MNYTRKQLEALSYDEVREIAKDPRSGRVPRARKPQLIALILRRQEADPTVLALRDTAKTAEFWKNRAKKLETELRLMVEDHKDCGCMTCQFAKSYLEGL